MDGSTELPRTDLILLQRALHLGAELCEALADSKDVQVAGSDFELHFTEFEAALNALPEGLKPGGKGWREIEEDWRGDAPGG